MTEATTTPRRRGDGPRMVSMSVAVHPDTRAEIARAAAADGVADGTLARAALVRGLAGEIEARRKRRRRETGRNGGRGAAE